MPFNETHDPDQELGSVFAAIVDLNGVLRGKRVPAAQAAKLHTDGIRMPLSVCNVDIWGADIEGSALVFETGDADGICHPTERGLLPLSYLSQPSALLPMWLSLEDGRPFAGDPRRALAAVAQRLARLGLTPVLATELEFYLYDPAADAPAPPLAPHSGKRVDSEGIMSLDALEQFDAVLNEVYAACAQQGIPADSAISEGGVGQFEINLKHVADPLRAADDAVFFKRILRGVARRHGLGATFMAKPYGTLAGNGLHVHFSLRDAKGRNVFDDGSATGSEMLSHAVGGLLQTMQDCALIWAPHANSYRRLRPGTHAPSAVSWGYENRTTALRIPGGPPEARRIEHRVSGADANPYLVIAAILGGALLGLERAVKPPAPITGDAYAQDLPALASDWAGALRAFETGPDAPEIFPGQLRQMLRDTKAQEMRRFAQRVTDFEYKTYLDVI